MRREWIGDDFKKETNFLGPLVPLLFTKELKKKPFQIYLYPLFFRFHFKKLSSLKQVPLIRGDKKKKKNRGFLGLNETNNLVSC